MRENTKVIVFYADGDAEVISNVRGLLAHQNMLVATTRNQHVSGTVSRVPRVGEGAIITGLKVVNADF